MALGRSGLWVAVACALGAGSWAAAQPQQVNISGATLFVNFFTKPASTNDFVNVDGDTYQQCFDHVWNGSTWDCIAKTCVTEPWAGFDPCYGTFTDQLAPSYSPASCSAPGAHWLLQYRGVGSGNGLVELRDFAIGNVIPVSIPSDYGYINRTKFAEGGQVVGIGSCGTCNASGTPVCPTSIDMGVMDVPTSWFVTSPGTPAFDRHPGSPGYGLYPVTSWCCCPGSESNKLKSLCITDPNSPWYGQCLNIDGSDPSRQVFDTEIAWVPIAFIANRGVSQTCGPVDSCIQESELKYLFLTGRMPTGENLIAATRDAGSGTRNGGMNSLCIDPSWSRGDNCGKKHSTTKYNLLGRHFRASNCGGSGEIELAVQNARLAIGYTGLAGSSRAAGDADAGRYEVLNVQFDARGGTVCIRPGTDPVLDVDPNDPNVGYPIGGAETFSTVGNPFESDPNSPTYMTNQEAAKYLRNIVESINAFVANPSSDDNTSMPGQLLAKEYFLVGGLRFRPNPLDPCDWVENVAFNPTLQNYIRVNSNLGMGTPGWDLPAFGAKSNLYPLPTRAKASDYQMPEFNPPGIVWPADGCDCAYPPDGFYSDGSDGTNYKNINGTNVTAPLPQSNWLAGDFNQDGCRDIDDIPAMVAAYYDRYVLAPGTFGYPWATYLAAEPNAPTTLCIDIIGDFNGDGNFDCRDLRYFADGLALVTTDGSKLHRWDAFVAIDSAWLALTGTDDNFFDTTIYGIDGVTPRPWVIGASAADVKGNTCVAPGAAPCGYDCRVDCEDAEYIDANFGYDWAILDQAVVMDLSCDITNDSKVDCEDVRALQVLLGGVCPNLAHPCPTICLGDADCNGVVDFDDINPFVAALSGATPCLFGNLDVNGDGLIDFDDINPFVAALTSGGECP